MMPSTIQNNRPLHYGLGCKSANSTGSPLNDPATPINSNTIRLRATTNSSSSPKASQRKCSLTLVTPDGECHDLSNLAPSSGDSKVYPRRISIQRILNEEALQSLQLWDPLSQPKQKREEKEPGYHRSRTAPARLQHQKHEQEPSPDTKSPLQRRRQVLQQQDLVSKGCNQPPLVGNRSRSKSPRRQSFPRRTETPVLNRPAASALSNRVPVNNHAAEEEEEQQTTQIMDRQAMARPGPRPKVDYKRLYGRGGSPTKDESDTKSRTTRRASMSSSATTTTRHMSFQQQLLQRTLEHEQQMSQSLRWDDDDDEEEQQPVMESSSRSERVRSCSTAPSSPVHQPKPVVTRTIPQDFLKDPLEFPTMPAGSGNTTKPRTVMEIAPQLFVPYLGSHETWKAVQAGNYTVTTCFACAEHLVVMDSVEFLVCPDCHSVSPLTYSRATGDRCGVGLGIKREWCDAAEASNHCQQPKQTTKDDDSKPKDLSPQQPRRATLRT